MRKSFGPVLLLLGFLLSPSAFAQSIDARLGGTVQDATGALIPGVTVTATNTGTGIVTTLFTNEAGVYQFASLQPGTYDIAAELPGFQTSIVRGFSLGGAQQARLNFTLEVGNVATAVEVQAAVDSLLATSSSSVGNVLPEYQVRDLPTANRNVIGLVGATAGVQSSGSFIGNFAGGRLSAVNTMRDGFNVSDGRFENGAFSVTHSSPDLVEEVNVVVGPVDAEASRGSGQVSMVTRSGGNDFNGSVFWVNQNSALDANNWFDNANNVEKSYNNRNQYGGRLGGPIIRNKTFFFVLFEGQRDLKRENATGATLTAMAREGIFRYFPGVQNNHAASANPTVDRDGNPVRPPNATGDLRAIGLFGSCMFNGAPVPNCSTFSDPLRSAIDNSAYMQESLRRMPPPNEFTGGDGLNTALIRFTRRVEGLDLANGNGSDVNRDQYNARIDHNFNQNHRLSIVATKEKNFSAAAQAGQRAWPDGFDGQQVRRPSVYTITFTSTLSPSLLNTLRLGQRKAINLQYGAPNRPDAVGAEALQFVPVANGVRYRPQPANWTSFVLYGGFGRWREHHSPMYTIGDDVSWIKGAHAFKGGFELRHTVSVGFGDPQFTPQVNLGAGASPVAGLDATVFPGLNANSATLARSLLTDLAGSVGSVGQAFGIASAQNTVLRGSPEIPYKWFDVHQREIGVYFKDDWKLTSNLTMNLGIRWDWYGQPVERNGVSARIVGDESALTGVTCTSSPGTPGFQSVCSNLTQVQFVGPYSNNPDLNVNLRGDDNNNFAPAVGISYNVPWFQRETVLRAGYGISYLGALRNFITVDGVLGTVPGVNLISGGSGLQWQPSTYTDLSTLTLPVPFPTGQATSSPFTVPVTDRSLSIQTYDRVSPYIQNWNVEIQREIARNTTVEIRYIGTNGTKLWGVEDLNQIDGLRRNRALFDAFNAVRAGGESPLLDQMLMGINLGGTGAQVVNGTTWTGAMAVRTNTTTRGQIANGNVGAFINAINTTLTTGTGSSDRGALLRVNGFPENYIAVNPQYAGVNMHRNMGNSTYHAMQLQFTRRLSAGFTNTTTWTWSKALGEADGDGGTTYRDPGNRSIEKTLLGFDRTHQITSSGAYELPFGNGRPLLNGAPGWVQQVVGGWQIGGIMNWNVTGAPLDITSGIQTISTVGVQPNIVGDLPKNFGKVTRTDTNPIYFEGYTQITDPGINNVSTLNGLRTAYNNRAIVNPSGQIVLVNPQPGEVGTLGYDWIKGPQNISLDMNVVKRFRIDERREFEFRVDAINVLNTPNFGNPNTAINNANFGQITSASGERSFVVNTRLNF